MARYDDKILYYIEGMHAAYREMIGMMSDKKFSIDMNSSFHARTPLIEDVRIQHSEIDKATDIKDLLKARKELITQFYMPIRQAYIDAVNIVNIMGIDTTQWKSVKQVLNGADPNTLMSADVDIGSSLPSNLQSVFKSAINAAPDKRGRNGKWSRKAIPELKLPVDAKKTEPTRAGKRKNAKSSARGHEFGASSNKSPVKRDASGEGASVRGFRTSTADEPTKTSSPPPETPSSGSQEEFGPMPPPNAGSGPSKRRRQRTQSGGAGPTKPQDAGTQGATTEATPGGAALKRMLEGMEDRLSRKIDKIDSKLNRAIRVGGKKLSSLKRGLDPNKLRNTGDLSDSAKLDQILHSMAESGVLTYKKTTRTIQRGKDEEEAGNSPAAKRRLRKQNHQGFWKTIGIELSKDIGSLGKDIHNTLFPYLKLRDKGGLIGMFGHEKDPEEEKNKKLIRETIDEWTHAYQKGPRGTGGRRGDKRRKAKRRETAEGSEDSWDFERRRNRKGPGGREGHTVEGETLHPERLTVADIQKLLTKQEYPVTKNGQNEEEQKGLQAHKEMIESDARAKMDAELKQILDELFKRQDKGFNLLGMIWNGFKNAWKWFSELKFIRTIWEGMQYIGKLVKTVSKPLLELAGKLGGRAIAGLEEALGVLSEGALTAGGIGLGIGAAVDAGMAGAMEASLNAQNAKHMQDFNKQFDDHLAMVGNDQYKILDDDTQKNKTFKFDELPEEYKKAIQHGNYLPTKAERQKLKAKSSDDELTPDEHEKDVRRREYGIGGTNYGDGIAPPAIKALPSDIPAALRQVSKEHFNLTETASASAAQSPATMQPIIVPTQTSSMGRSPDLSLGLPINTTATGQTISQQMGIYRFRTPGGSNFR